MQMAFYVRRGRIGRRISSRGKTSFQPPIVNLNEKVGHTGSSWSADLSRKKNLKSPSELLLCIKKTTAYNNSVLNDYSVWINKMND